MVNENITKNFVRSHFAKSDELQCHEGTVDKATGGSRLYEALQAASKHSRNKHGYPDFTYTYKEVKTLVIVVECKANKKNHCSRELNNPKGYAIDGVLHYASKLSSRYDVIAIAVSGEQNPIISTYAWLKTSDKPTNLRLDELLYPKRYQEIITKLKTPIVNRENLYRTARKLHNYLRDNAKISETEKPLVVSAILLALTCEAFAASYVLERNGTSLAKELMKRLNDVLTNARLPEAKIQNMMQQYSFIPLHPELTKGNTLAEIVAYIDTHIRPIIVTHPNEDILGHFYGEFLHYVGGDKKGLGIVLTPKHICQLMVKMVRVHKNSVLLDTCCGTAGFLIAGMHTMLSRVKENTEKQKEIKRNQLIGIEQSPNMFTLAASNMLLRGDGTANLYSASCFGLEETILAKHKPTAACINPPFAQKGSNLSELDFVRTMLNCLVPGSLGAAIVPTSAVTQNTRLKEELLAAHTLEAVISLPIDTFYPVGTVTCIVVFKAKQPHPDGYKTWFSLWKDDGFVKSKSSGRTDKWKTWKNISKGWIDSYNNRLDKDGTSVNKNVTKDDEWLAETHIPINYDKISSHTIIENIRALQAFHLLKKKLPEPTLYPTDTWKYFKLSSIFSIEVGTISNVQDWNQGTVPVVTASAYNNGITTYINPETPRRENVRIRAKIFPSDCITLAKDGSIGQAFYQSKRFCANTAIAVLIPKFQTNWAISIFLCTLLRLEGTRYNYGYKWGIDKIKNTQLKLPVNTTGSPNWVFIQKLVKELKNS